MLVFILIAVTVLLLLVLAIVARKCYNKNKGPKILQSVGDDLGDAVAVLDIIFGFPIMLGVLIAAIVTATPYNQKKVQIWYTETSQYLNASKERLLTSPAGTIERLDITSYNEQVSEFRNEILNAQLDLENPWLNWYTCPAYANLDPNIVSYI